MNALFNWDRLTQCSQMNKKTVQQAQVWVPKVGPNNSRVNRDTCDFRVAARDLVGVNDIGKLTLAISDPASSKPIILSCLEVLENNATRGCPAESHRGGKDNSSVSMLGPSLP